MAPTQNPDFLRALQLLLDRELIKKALFRGYGTVANDQPMPPWHPYFNADLPQRAYDPEQARFLLKRAGLLGVRLPVYASPAAEGSVDMASMLQEAAGEHRPAPRGQPRARRRLLVQPLDEASRWASATTIRAPRADMLFTQLFRSDAQWNESGWKNERFDQLLLLARGEADEARRKAAVRRDAGAGPRALRRRRSRCSSRCSTATTGGSGATARSPPAG